MKLSETIEEFIKMIISGEPLGYLQAIEYAERKEYLSEIIDAAMREKGGA